MGEARTEDDNVPDDFKVPHLRNNVGAKRAIS